MSAQRSYDGPAIDATGQHISEAPYWQRKGKTVDVVDETPIGEERTENVPVPGETPDRDLEGQTTLSDWGGGAQ